VLKLRHDFAALVVELPDHDSPGDHRQEAGDRTYAAILFQKPVLIVPQSGKHGFAERFPLGRR